MFWETEGPFIRTAYRLMHCFETLPQKSALSGWQSAQVDFETRQTDIADEAIRQSPQTERSPATWDRTFAFSCGFDYMSMTKNIKKQRQLFVAATKTAFVRPHRHMNTHTQRTGRPTRTTKVIRKCSSLTMTRLLIVKIWSYVHCTSSMWHHYM